MGLGGHLDNLDERSWHLLAVYRPVPVRTLRPVDEARLQLEKQLERLMPRIVAAQRLDRAAGQQVRVGDQLPELNRHGVHRHLRVVPLTVDEVLRVPHPPYSRLAAEYITNTKHGGREGAWLGAVSWSASLTAADN